MAHLDAEGVECTWVTYDQPSQHSAVIVARGDATRTIIWLPQPMADARMIEQLPEFLEGVDVALLDATDESLATAALDECETRGVTTVIDTGSGRPWTASLLGRVDHVIAPEKYVLKETGHPAERAAVELWGDSCRVVFGVTQGPRGGVFATGKEPECLGRWDAAPVTAVDSCGAGDTFHGAYAWAVAKGLSPAECFDTAAWSAALKVSQLGNKGIPTLDQLEKARAEPVPLGRVCRRGRSGGQGGDGRSDRRRGVQSVCYARTMISGVGLVLEGGGMRTTYTGGVLDAFMDAGIDLGYVIGVSAGANAGSHYVAGQRERSHRVFVDLVADPRYAGWRNLLRERSWFGMRLPLRDPAGRAGAVRLRRLPRVAADAGGRRDRLRDGRGAVLSAARPRSPLVRADAPARQLQSADALAARAGARDVPASTAA